jgi:heme exporter protein A
VLDAVQLSCEKQDRILFQDIDLSIKTGELVLLKGENGAGKTSLLRILVGLSQPQNGNVRINQHDVQSDVNLASSQLVYVGHKLGLSALLNPIENLQFYCQSIGQEQVAQNDIIDILEQLGLHGHEDLSVKNLSAGQQRRVALAKLWLHKTANLWVLDEPFTALDVATVELLQTFIAEFLQRGGGVIMTSHQAVRIDHPIRVFELEYAW